MKLIAEASDGQEAVEQFRKHQPDVTLMDLQMPNMNGIDATGQSRARNLARGGVSFIAFSRGSVGPAYPLLPRDVRDCGIKAGWKYGPLADPRFHFWPSC